MKIGQRLELKQSQRLVMTPQLQQALQVLQMPSIDVAAFIAEQVEANPILRLEEPARAEVAAAPEPAAPAAGDNRARSEAEVGRSTEGFDTGRENLSGGDSRMGASGEPAARPTGAAQATDGSVASFEEYTAQSESLRDLLRGQIATARIDRATRMIAEYLIDELDEDGYMRASLDGIADRLSAPRDAVAEALARVQECDPPGVGARNLRECFEIQLRQKDRFDPAMAALVENLDLLAAHKRDGLRAACGVDEEDLDDMIAELRALDARPGSSFSEAVAQTVIPDVFIRENGVGGWLVELNGEVLPRVLVDQDYATELSAAGATEAKSFVADCKRNANWLTRLLDQRAQTILNVTTEIVRRQSMFFHKGVPGLRPMTLKDVAEAIDMHESTVSRVAANKHLYCGRGLLPLKFFFTRAIEAVDGGDSISARVVQSQIKVLIDKENPAKPLSDDRIVTLLKQSGVNLARRTVAKYREVMNIPSSSKRKRIKAQAKAYV
ncbi:MAG: RNA polymerase factor sigma-54, partial [Pseudomonadota bacterium]